MNHRERVSEVKGESIIPEFFMMSLVSYAPRWFKPLVGYLAEKTRGEIRFAELMKIRLTTENSVLL